jgi:hypothetical protein
MPLRRGGALRKLRRSRDAGMSPSNLRRVADALCAALELEPGIDVDEEILTPARSKPRPTRATPAPRLSQLLAAMLTPRLDDPVRHTARGARTGRARRSSRR